MLSALLSYYFIALIYIIVQFKKDKSNWIVKLFIAIFCPFIGFVLLYFMFHSLKNNENHLNEEMIRKDKDIPELLNRVNVEKELRVVPIKEALIMNDNQTKRNMLLNLLKNESFKNIEILQTALQNEDTETSHYAAVAIQDIKGKLLSTMQQLEFQMEQNENDVELLKTSAQVIKQYLDTGFLDERTNKQYLYKYTLILEKVIHIVPTEKEHYIEKINSDLKLGELETAEEYSTMFLQYCSNEEESYFMALKIYYILKNPIKFNEMLFRLRQSSIRLSPQGLNKIRFWLYGDVNGA